MLHLQRHHLDHVHIDGRPWLLDGGDRLQHDGGELLRHGGVHLGAQAGLGDGLLGDAGVGPTRG